MGEIEDFRSRVQAASILAQSGDEEAQRVLEQEFRATSNAGAKRRELAEAFSAWDSHRYGVLLRQEVESAKSTARVLSAITGALTAAILWPVLVEDLATGVCVVALLVLGALSGAAVGSWMTSRTFDLDSDLAARTVLCVLVSGVAGAMGPLSIAVVAACLVIGWILPP